MKKSVLSLAFALTVPMVLASCSFNFSIGGDESGGKPTFGKNVVPLHEEETIKRNIGSYSSSFKITTYDGIYDFDVKYDCDLNAGIVTREGTDFYFIRGKDNSYLAYYENEYGYGYIEDWRMSTEFRMNLLYMNLLFDITAEIQENAPYASKKELTYAGREATQYIVTNKAFIIPDTTLDLVLDNQTGAVLSLKYDNIDFYQSSSFVPNDTEASKAVKAKHDTLAFEFFDKDVLALVGLEDIKIPNWYEKSATFSCLDDSSTNASNMSDYSVQYFEILRSTEEIEKIAKSIYEKGIKYNINNELKTYDELFEKTRDTVNYTVVDTVRFNGYVVKGGTTYNVVFQGTNQSTDPDCWYMTLAINKILLS